MIELILFALVSNAATPTAPAMSKAAMEAQQHAEILHEMFQVVLLEEPKNRSEFGSLVDTLNQGASFEGIYNGLTHSSHYRSLEEKYPTATDKAHVIFNEELKLMDTYVDRPTLFSPADAKPIAEAVQPTDNLSGIALEKKSRDVVKIFQSSSFFTLKRVLSDEALKLIDEKKSNRAELAKWYGPWAARLAGAKVDFGLELRNRPDPKFHQEWAMKATEDQIDWEVLNRIHRLMNQANREKK